MRSGIGNSASDPLFTSAVSASGAAQPGDATGTYVIGKGGSNIVTNQVTVGTTATQVAAARAGRQEVTIISTAATVFYVGNSGVTTANGLYVAAAAGAAITLKTAAAVFAVVATGTLLVTYAELY